MRLKTYSNETSTSTNSRGFRVCILSKLVVCHFNPQLPTTELAGVGGKIIVCVLQHRRTVITLTVALESQSMKLTFAG